jgi:hypothetical protein
MVKGFFIAARNTHPLDFIRLSIPFIPTARLNIFDISRYPPTHQNTAKKCIFCYTLTTYPLMTDRFHGEAAGCRLVSGGKLHG